MSAYGRKQTLKNGLDHFLPEGPLSSRKQSFNMYPMSHQAQHLFGWLTHSMCILFVRDILGT